MKKLLKRSLLFGLGALSLTREKAEKLVRELVEKGEVTSDEATEFVNELVERGKHEHQALKDAVGREVNNLRTTTGFVTREELTAFENRLNKLEAWTAVHNARPGENGGQEVE
ncbi:MAG: phasin family protein [Eubacteriales bacterium]